MLDKEYAVNMLTALVDAAEEMNGHGIKANCLAVNDAVLDTIRGLITYLQNSEKVVRCKDCKYGHMFADVNVMPLLSCNYKNAHGMLVENHGYCKWGKRKDGDGNDMGK